MNLRKASASARTAVILSGSTNGLGTVRSLYKAGVPTIAVAEKRNEPVLYSRLPKRKLLVPSSHSEDRERDLLRLLLTLDEERPVLIPTTDAFVSFMSKNRQCLAERFDFCLPNDRLIEQLNDKAKETELIASLGIPLPKTIQNLPSSPRQLMKALRLPVIIKARTFKHVSILGQNNLIIRTGQEMDSFYEKFCQRFGALIAQEIIPGEDDATSWQFSGIFSSSHELLSAFTYRRLWLSPPHFGVTSYAISQQNDKVINLVSKLGKGLEYNGPAGVEFKFDARDGQYKYIETNPRLPLCTFFDATCGVNNVLCAYRLAIGADVQPGQLQQRDGVIYLRLFEDLSSRLEDGKGVLSIFRHYLTHSRLPHVEAYFARNDMGPALFQVARLFPGLWRRLRRNYGYSGRGRKHLWRHLNQSGVT